MSHSKEILGRIKSIRSIQKTTKAMQMISAAKLRRSQQRLNISRLCAGSLEKAVMRSVHNILADPHSETITDKWIFNGQLHSYVLILIASDRGLCGSFNSVMMKFATAYIHELQASGKDVKLVVCGKKLYDLLKSNYHNIIVKFHANSKGFANFTEFELFAHELGDCYEADAIEVLYHRFDSTMLQTPIVQRLVPAYCPTDEFSKEKQSKKRVRVLYSEVLDNLIYKYEPDPAKSLRQAMKMLVMSSMYSAFIEGSTSEHCARMVAMEAANRNTKDMLNKLILNYNRTRQAAITTGLIEIIGGAEALN